MVKWYFILKYTIVNCCYSSTVLTIPSLSFIETSGNSFKYGITKTSCIKVDIHRDLTFATIDYDQTCFCF